MFDELLVPGDTYLPWYWYFYSSWHFGNSMAEGRRLAWLACLFVTFNDDRVT